MNKRSSLESFGDKKIFDIKEEDEDKEMRMMINSSIYQWGTS